MTSRPSDELRPSDTRLLQAYDAINGGNAEVALQLVEGYQSTSEYSGHWANYIRGLALFATQKLDEGLSEFLSKDELGTLYHKLLNDPKISVRDRLLAERYAYQWGVL